MKRCYFQLILLTVILLSTGWFPASAQEDNFFQDDFEAGGSQLWDLDPGWEIAEADGSSVLRGEGHTWARLDLSIPGDFQLTFRLNVVRGRVHLVTHNSARSRYFSGIGREPSHLNKQFYPDTFQNGLAGGTRSYPLDTWLEIRYTFESGTLRLWINGEEQWSYSDPEPLGQGAIAFETLEDSLALIDDLVITVEGPEPEQGAPSAAENGDQGWIRTGGPLGGLGYDVRMDPGDPDRMYVTDAFAGVFISEDGGNSWYPSNQGLTDRTGESMDAIPVFCLTVSPHDPDVVWAGMQFSGGLYRSDDGGRTWVRKTSGLTLQDGLTFRGITIDPRDPEIVYAAGEISSWAWAGDPINGREFDLTKGVLYKSENGGETWREIWRGDNLARYIWVNPRNTAILYLSTGIFDREAANSDPKARIPGGVGVLKSTDGGQTWQEANTGLGNLYVGTLYMHPQDPDVLLAGTGNNQYWEQGGIYLSTNGAESWQLVFGEEYNNINAVEYSETEPQIAYAGSSNTILRSQDGGMTWERVSPEPDSWGTPGVRGGFPIDFQVDPRDPERIFANNYGGGNFLSEDGGRTWQVASSGYTGAQVRSIAIDPEHPGRVYAAARSGIFLSPDGGNTWTGLARQPFQVLEWNAVAVDPSHPDHLLSANNWSGGILSSEDGGFSWEMVLGRVEGEIFIRSLAFAPSDPRWVYAGSGAFVSAGVFSPELAAQGIYLSQDGGRTWQPSPDGQFADAHVINLAVSPTDHEIAYAATSNYGVLRTADSGQNWEQVNQGLVMRRGASAVAVHPQDPELVFAGVPFGGVYRSQNGGGSWQQVSAGMNPEANISDLVIDPSDPEIVYASDLFSGVYRSSDGGNTWNKFSEGLRLEAVNKLALSASGEHLYAATEGEGVYRIDLSGQPPEAVALELPQEDPAPGDDPGEEQASDDQAAAESQDASGSQAAGDESSPGSTGIKRQVCPGSYLPLVLGLVGLGSWWNTRSRIKER